MATGNRPRPSSSKNKWIEQATLPFACSTHAALIRRRRRDAEGIIACSRGSSEARATTPGNRKKPRSPRRGGSPFSRKPCSMLSVEPRRLPTNHALNNPAQPPANFAQNNKSNKPTRQTRIEMEVAPKASTREPRETREAPYEYSLETPLPEERLNPTQPQPALVG